MRLNIMLLTVAASSAPVLKKPTFEQLVADRRVTPALRGLLEWLDGSSGPVQKRIAPALETLSDLFGKPSCGCSVYRAFPLKSGHKMVEGGTYAVATSKNLIQSWTTSETGALAFVKEVYGDKDTYCVAKLVSSGEELANYLWLNDLLAHMSKVTIKKTDSSNLFYLVEQVQKQFGRFKAEREVIMLLPKTSTVTIVALTDANGNRKPK